MNIDGFLHKPASQSPQDFCLDYRPSSLQGPQVAWIYAQSPHHTSHSRHTDESLNRSNVVLARLKTDLDQWVSEKSSKSKHSFTKKIKRDQAVEDICVIAKDEGNTWFDILLISNSGKWFIRVEANKVDSVWKSICEVYLFFSYIN
jgi:hypothetical protein